MPSQIHFFYEDVTFRLHGSRETKAWIKRVIEVEKKNLVELNFIFCSDSMLSQINLQYLQHNTLTDIITFSNGVDPSLIEGDIYISVDRVKENALNYNASFDNELKRVMIHGVLHLIGYSDKTQQQKSIMRKKEDACLSLRSN